MSCSHGHSGLSRRKFLERLGLTCAAGGLSAGLAGMRCAAAEEDSGPVDCGPPPKAKPQHRTGGEALRPAAAAGHARCGGARRSGRPPRRP